MRPSRCVFILCVLLSGAPGCSGDDDGSGGSGTMLAGDASDPFGNARDSAVPVAMLPDGGDPTIGMCGAEPFVANAAPVNVLLVIDKSGSMLDVPDGFDVDKWSAMKASLGTVLADVPDSLSLGLLLYPSDGCDVPMDVAVGIEAGTSARSDITSALDDATPAGGTPTAAALARALAYFADGPGAALTGDNYVLLATDGGPNCNAGGSCEATQCTVNLDGECPMGVSNCCDAAQAGPGAEEGCLDAASTENAIDALADARVPTFVVGIPGTEQYASSLDAFANAGGRPNADAPPSYYAVTAQGDEPGGLTEVLAAITSSVIKSCRLQLGSNPPALDRLNVKVDGEIVPQSGDDGWEIDTATDPPTIELLGATCDRVESQGVESVEVLFGCPTILG